MTYPSLRILLRLLGEHHTRTHSHTHTHIHTHSPVCGGSYCCCLFVCTSQGNLQLMSDALQKYEVFFIHYRIYLVLVKLKMIVYRNLFKKV